MTDAPNRRQARRWRLLGAPSWLVSIAAHGLLIVLLSLLTWIVVIPEPIDQAMQVGASPGGGGIGEDRTLGESSGNADVASPSRATESVSNEQSTSAIEAMASAMELSVSGAGSASGTISELAGELSDAQGLGGGGQGGRQGFGGVLEGLRRQGAEVVLVIDATASMQPYIEQAKDRIEQVIDLLVELLGEGNVRLGAVAYKDYGDRFGKIGEPIEFVPLSDDSSVVSEFIDNLIASGGGTPPEPVHLALAQATSRDMKWRRSRARFILIIGDSPIHDDGVDAAERNAAAFARSGGVVSVIDVGGAAGRRSLQPHLADVARAGGGDAFLLRDEDAFWRYLIILVFGEAFRHDVDEIIDRHLESR